MRIIAVLLVVAGTLVLRVNLHRERRKQPLSVMLGLVGLGLIVLGIAAAFYTPLS